MDYSIYLAESVVIIAKAFSFIFICLFAFIATLQVILLIKKASKKQQRENYPFPASSNRRRRRQNKRIIVIVLDNRNTYEPYQF